MEHPNPSIMINSGWSRRTPLIITPNWWEQENNKQQQEEEERGRHHRSVILLTLQSDKNNGVGDDGGGGGGGDVADWKDLAFLAAIPASAALNQGKPTVIVPGDESDRDDDALIDFLMRYQPHQLSIFSRNKRKDIQIIRTTTTETDDNTLGRIEYYDMESLHTVTIDLSNIFRAAAAARNNNSIAKTQIVVAPMEDYSACLLASSVAARLQVPLFFVEYSSSSSSSSSSCHWNKDVLEHLQQNYATAEIILVRGKSMSDEQVTSCMDQTGGNPSGGVVCLMDTIDTIQWFTSQHNNIPVQYLAVVNPNDRMAATRECASRKLSLTAPVYAAHRNGLVLSLDNNIPVYNQLGRLEQYDQQALRTVLQGLRDTIRVCPKPPPAHVAIVGGFNVMPTCQTNSKLGTIHAVSDIPYGQLLPDDDDNNCYCSDSKRTKSFRDIAFGRIYAESLTCGSLLAARTVNYEFLVESCSNSNSNNNWTSSLVEGGTWGFPELSSLAQTTGLCSTPRRMFQSDIDQVKTVEASTILHKDHSCATHLGNFIKNNSRALYAPAVVITRGCHGAGIDEGTDAIHGTVPGRMLGRGCVSYLGAPRTATTGSTLTEVTFYHELLYSSKPLSVGQALQIAYNKSVVHQCDGGTIDNYCFENEILLGDPALVPCFVGAGLKMAGPLAAAAMTTSTHNKENNIVTVTGPSEWRKTPIERGQLDEWKWKGDLYTYVCGNVGQETIWGPGYDKQELYHVVSVDVPIGLKVKHVHALNATECIGGKTLEVKNGSDWTKNWWPTGKFFEQNNADGTTAVRWRVRMLDYDMPTGEIKAELKTAQFQLVF